MPTIDIDTSRPELARIYGFTAEFAVRAVLNDLGPFSATFTLADGSVMQGKVTDQFDGTITVASREVAVAQITKIQIG